MFIIAYLGFAIVTVATVQSGLHGDPTRTNPNPGPAPYPPFLGFDNWPLAVSISSVPLAIGLIAVLVWLCWRQRKVHWPSDKNPYPEVNLYDPYGHLEDAGKPGPFYR